MLMALHKINCAIVDDEPYAIELIRQQIKNLPQLVVTKTFSDPVAALAEISASDNIHILFLDIDMPELSGLDLALKLKNRVKHIVFVTAYPNFALEAFGVRADDYLLKPIEPFRFIESVQNILSGEPSANLEDPNLFIKGELKGKYLNIQVDEIILIYVKSHLMYIETINGQFKTNETLKHVEERLKTRKKFLRVHHSNIVNAERIVKVEGNMIYMQGKWEVPISDNYKKEFIELLETKMLNLKR